MRVESDHFSLSASRTYILIIISALCYFILAYYTQRHHTTTLIATYSVLFIAYLLIQRTELPLNQVLFAAFFFRFIFLLSIPALSDDFYRFIWDGNLIAGGINPFSLRPSQIFDNPSINIPGISQQLFQSLNSPDYYSVYPPVCQFVFWVAAVIGDDNILVNVIVMRLFIIGAEVGTVALLLKLFKVYGFDQRFTFLYLLNPLIIMEFAGNLHFESLMIFFVLAAVFYMKKQNFLFSGIFFALAISTKLIPLIFLPFILKRIRKRESVVVYLTTGVVTLFTFLPVLNSMFINGFSSSLSLYFQKFEFNASIFYIVREVGFIFTGFDIIQVAGVVLAFIAFVLIIFAALKDAEEKNLLLGVFIWPVFIYLAFSTIVHPWYVTPLIAFSLFSRFRFPIIWSFLIFFTYLGYSETGYTENFLVIMIEYLAVFGAAIYELNKYKPFNPNYSRHNANNDDNLFEKH